MEDSEKKYNEAINDYKKAISDAVNSTGKWPKKQPYEYKKEDENNCILLINNYQYNYQIMLSYLYFCLQNHIQEHRLNKNYYQ